jgi:putative SOS response-associated peptidase YedK
MELLRPAREQMLVATPVSERVNPVKNDDPECLTPRVLV